MIFTNLIQILVNLGIDGLDNTNREIMETENRFVESDSDDSDDQSKDDNNEYDVNDDARIDNKQ